MFGRFFGAGHGGGDARTDFAGRDRDGHARRTGHGARRLSSLGNDLGNLRRLQQQGTPRPSPRAARSQSVRRRARAGKGHAKPARSATRRRELGGFELALHQFGRTRKRAIASPDDCGSRRGRSQGRGGAAPRDADAAPRPGAAARGIRSAERRRQRCYEGGRRARRRDRRPDSGQDFATEQCGEQLFRRKFVGSSDGRGGDAARQRRGGSRRPSRGTEPHRSTSITRRLRRRSTVR